MEIRKGFLEQQIQQNKSINFQMKLLKETKCKRI